MSLASAARRHNRSSFRIVADVGSQGKQKRRTRFLIFDSPDRQRLVKLGEVEAGQTSLDLRETNLQPGDWLLVKAQAKAGMVDALSDPVKYGDFEPGRGESNPR